jgi:saccharopine dehydrogenase-like NADP-dependent oxidoreductase
MHRILLLGAGKIGGAAARLLAGTGAYELKVGDVEAKALERLQRIPNLKTEIVDVSDPARVRAAMEGCHAVISACSFTVNPGIARAALDAGLSYFDLTEDVATTRAVRQVSGSARPGQIFMPQCGLAPGFVAICAHALTRKLEKMSEVRMRVGALPQFPSNIMKYNLTWSTDGLINEYGNLCEAIYEGRLIEVLPLEGLEHFSLDGVDYEAFNTSGGLGTLCETLDGKVRTLDYKTVRYKGHRDLMAFLLNELRLNDRRPLLKDILESSIPITLQDVVLTFCTVTGWREGRLVQVTDARKIYHQDVAGEPWSAIQVTTAAGVCAVVDLHFEGRLPSQGFVRQEQVDLEVFLANRFGKYYVAPQITTPIQMYPA